MLSPAQVSEMLNISIATLGWWRRNQIGPRSFKLGSSTYRYQPADVIAFLDSVEATGIVAFDPDDPQVTSAA